MCIIIDTNQLSRFIKHPDDHDMAPIHNWIRQSGRLVFSFADNFSTEVKSFAQRWLLERSRAGQAHSISNERVSEEATRLRESGLSIKSDDEHVLALARVSKARLLFTKDQRLMDDFKNKEIIDSPRGSVYQRAIDHKPLLTTTVCPRRRIG